MVFKLIQSTQQSLFYRQFRRKLKELFSFQVHILPSGLHSCLYSQLSLHLLSLSNSNFAFCFNHHLHTDDFSVCVYSKYMHISKYTYMHVMYVCTCIKVQIRSVAQSCLTLCDRVLKLPVSYRIFSSSC